MAKKRKRRSTTRAGTPPGRVERPAPASPGGQDRQSRASSGAPPRSAQRRAHKEEARLARERARRRYRRSSLIRRAGIAAAVVAVIAAGLTLLVRSGTIEISDAALAAADAAGCGDVQTPEGSAPGGQHLDPGQSYTYSQHPATSGFHDPSPLPSEPHVYDSPVPETQAVHNLEHAYVLIYYRQDGTDALPRDVVDRLKTLAESENKVIMAPYPDLPSGTGLALAAWNKLWECPSSITASQARTVAAGFIDAYRGSGNAPEPGQP